MLDTWSTAVWLRLAVALGIGLLLGAERERHMGRQGRRGPAGIRTFALVALAGGIAEQVGGGLLTSVAALLVGLTALAAYWRSPDSGGGITTEIGLLVALLLGVLAQAAPGLASALAVSVTILLATRTTLHRFVSTVLTDQEVHDALTLAAAAIVLLPLLPNHPVDPLGALNPFAVWRLVVLIMAMSALGYVAGRALGGRFGLPLSGLAGGLVSSAATIGAMGALGKAQPHLQRAALAGALLSCVATPIELAAVVAASSPRALVPLAWPLAAAATTAIACGGFALVRIPAFAAAERQPGRAFSLLQAIGIAVLISVITLLSSLVARLAGGTGVAFASGLAGLADVHAAAIGVAALYGSGRLSTDQIALPVLIAFTTNALTKVVLAFSAGVRRHGLAVLGSLALSTGSAWLTFVLTR